MDEVPAFKVVDNMLLVMDEIIVLQLNLSLTVNLRL